MKGKKDKRHKLWSYNKFFCKLRVLSICISTNISHSTDDAFGKLAKQNFPMSFMLKTWWLEQYPLLIDLQCLNGLFYE